MARSVSTFPCFDDGDVEIHLTSRPKDKLVLHSYVLALHSAWFKASLSERWNGGNTEADAISPKTWVYELRFDKDSCFGLLSQRTGDENPPTLATELFSGFSGRRDQHKAAPRRLQKIQAHVQLFGMIYHVVPSFNVDDWETTSHQLVDLREAASAYAAEAIMRPHIESYLGRNHVKITEQCALRPVSMLEFANTFESQWIFREAAAYTVGMNKTAYSRVKKNLEEAGMLSVFERKRSMLEDKLKSCELDLLLLQAPGYNIKEVRFFATGYFREWLTTSLQQGGGSGLGKEYASVYRTISRRAQVLTDRDLLQLKMEYEGPVPKAKDVHLAIRGALERLHRSAASLIAPLLRDVTMRQDPTDNPKRPLLFMTVDDDELPWAGQK